MNDQAEIEKGAQHIAEICSIPVPIALILYQRGYTSPQMVKNFLYPDFSSLPMPGEMKGMNNGVACMVEAILNKENIVIHGDYDVDGVTGTVLLLDFFRQLGIEAQFHVPNRLTDEYGLTTESIRSIYTKLNNSPGVIITVDCGITSCEAINYAYSLGFKVIVTDHHEPKKTIPSAEAIINPKQEGCGFPFKYLSGVGVAFFFIAALRRELINRDYWQDLASIPNLKQYLDLVALGTVADVMPLTAINRVLVRGGLEVLNNGRREGIAALCRESGMHQKDKLVSEDISFKLAPRINAAGRMGDARTAIELLFGHNKKESKNKAVKLEQYNAARKETEQAVLQDIFHTCETMAEEGYKGLAVFHPDCHPGILGIIASRVVERFHLPAVIVTNENAEKNGEILLKGSGRSIPGINLLGKIEQCKASLTRFGGHIMAVGVTLEQRNWEKFKLDFAGHCAQEQNVDFLTQQVCADCNISDKTMLTRDFTKYLQLLQPFGEDNPEPTFHLKGVELSSVKTVGDHLCFELKISSQEKIRGIGFNMAEKVELARKTVVDLVFKLRFSYFRGSARREILLVDVS